MRPGIFRILVPLFAALLLLSACHPRGEERTVTGTLVSVDEYARTLTVQDGNGVKWNFTVDRNAKIDLSPFSVGSKVRVTIARGTPPNMSSAADRIRKGDRIEEVR